MPTNIGPLQRVIAPSWVTVLSRVAVLAVFAALVWTLWPDLFGGVARRGAGTWAAVVVPAAAAFALARHARRVGISLHEAGVSFWLGDGVREIAYREIRACAFHPERSFLELRSDERVGLPSFVHASKPARDAMEAGVAASAGALP